MAQENPAQPNFVATANAYATLAQELPLFANLPVANVQQQLDQVLAGIAALSQRLDEQGKLLAQILQEQKEQGQRVTQIVQDLGDVNKSLARIDGRLQAVQQRMDSLPFN